jgi:ribonuclease III
MISELENNIQYIFIDKNLVQTALCHSSYINEQTDEKLADNEKLEFLGDAVLNLTAGHLLMDHFPDLNEGDLSRMRANLVNETRLASIARTMNLGKFLKLGKGEIQTQGHEKNSILADAYEAIIAAVYLDKGFDAAFQLVKTHFAPLLHSIAKPMDNMDYKSRLQEIVQVAHKSIPSYQIIEESGPDHDKTFVAQLKVKDIVTLGSGKSKKMAEQEAAKQALIFLEKSTPDEP